MLAASGKRRLFTAHTRSGDSVDLAPRSALFHTPRQGVPVPDLSARRPSSLIATARFRTIP